LQHISEYDGRLLNHLAVFYRPGERDLAWELAEAIGMTAVDIPIAEGFSLIAAHPNDDDRDITNNIIFLSEMEPMQAALDGLIAKKAAADPELSEVLNAYRERSKAQPESHPHFGIRFTSSETLDPVVEKLRTQLSPALRERVTVTETPPYGTIPPFPDIRQVFVHTDVFATGSHLYGQIIELQVERGK
jgi:hypothetical protein